MLKLACDKIDLNDGQLKKELKIIERNYYGYSPLFSYLDQVERQRDYYKSGEKDTKKKLENQILNHNIVVKEYKAVIAERNKILAEYTAVVADRDKVVLDRLRNRHRP